MAVEIRRDLVEFLESADFNLQLQEYPGIGDMIAVDSGGFATMLSNLVGVTVGRESLLCLRKEIDEALAKEDAKCQKSA